MNEQSLPTDQVDTYHESLDFIKSERAKGQTWEQIRSQLLDNGWTEDKVRVVFGIYQGNTVPKFKFSTLNKLVAGLLAASVLGTIFEPAYFLWYVGAILGLLSGGAYILHSFTALFTGEKGDFLLKGLTLIIFTGLIGFGTCVANIQLGNF